MAEPIDRPGVFRGKLTEWGVQATKKGFPQFVGRVSATEYYDHEEGDWVDWSEYDQSLFVYLVLFNDQGPLLNYEQAQKAFGWDGASFAELSHLDLADREFLFRVEEDEYQGQVRLRVNWVDDYDAPPQRELSSLDDDALKDLDSKFAAGLKSKPKAAPAKAKKSAPKKKAEKKEEKTEAKAPPKKSAPKKTEKKTEKKKDGPSPCTKEEAWSFLCDAKSDDISDDALAEAWIDACEEVLGAKDEDDATTEDWGNVKFNAADKLKLIPF